MAENVLEHALDILKTTDWKKRVLIRVDFNVPVAEGRIVDPTRILSARETIDFFLKKGQRVLLLSHFKDPKELDLKDPKDRERFSFKTLANEIGEILGCPVFVLDLTQPDLDKQVDGLPASAVVLLENSRFWPGEKTCDAQLSKRLAALGGVFVNEAFSCAHRKHATTIGITKYLPSFPGFHFQKEIQALRRAFESPEHPVLAIMGGAKISTKLPVMDSLLPKVDMLAVGGAMAHTFLMALGVPVGKSLVEPAYVPQAQQLLETFRGKIVLPVDLVVAPDLPKEEEMIRTEPEIVSVELGSGGVPEDLAAFDIGPATVTAWTPLVHQAKTIIWNGTLGVAEVPPYDDGTRKVAQLIGKNRGAFSLAGGGDTLSALNELKLIDRFSHVCTGGGAFLEWIAHGSLPAEKTWL